MIPPIHVDEIYRCDICDIIFDITQVTANWKCPHCTNPLSIKVEIGDYLKNCHRLKPEELKKGDLTTFNKINSHRILNITLIEDKYRVELGQHGVEYYNKNDFLLVSDGAWHE